MGKARRLAAGSGEWHRHFLIAEAALDHLSQLPSAAVGIDHPRSHLERRLVTHVPSVAAGELGHPETVLVLVETGDRALHPFTVRGFPHPGGRSLVLSLESARRP